MGARYDNTFSNELGSTENEIRNSLLNLGRDHKGTHFIILDADRQLVAILEIMLILLMI